MSSRVKRLNHRYVGCSIISCFNLYIYSEFPRNSHVEVLTTKNYLWSNHTIPKVLELSFSQEKQLENVSLFAILTTALDFLMHNHVTGVCIIIVPYIRSYFSAVDHLSPTSLNPQTQTATIEEQSAFKFPEVRNKFRSLLFSFTFHWVIIIHIIIH